MPRKKDTQEAEILKLMQGRVTVCIRGLSPLICNAMSAKAWRQILLPRKKTAVERSSSLKHDPPQEYRDSIYRTRGGPTVLGFPSVAFKRALASTATDVGGAKRAQMDRLVWAIGELIPVYGTQRLLMSVVRSADMARTPDIRTRAIVPEWACSLTLAYVMPTITQTAVVNLLASAGLVRGVGDWRQEKGGGNYGQFEIVDSDDADYLRILEQGREAQQDALDNIVCHDHESETMLAWWHEEVARRGREQQTNGKPTRRKRKNGAESTA